MELRYYIDKTTQKKVYTLKEEAPDGSPTLSGHPARFSPDDKYSMERVTCKQRFQLLPT